MTATAARSVPARSSLSERAAWGRVRDELSQRGKGGIFGGNRRVAESAICLRSLVALPLLRELRDESTTGGIRD